MFFFIYSLFRLQLCRSPEMMAKSVWFGNGIDALKTIFKFMCFRLVIRKSDTVAIRQQTFNIQSLFKRYKAEISSFPNPCFINES